jgi:hypothetical protein
MTAVEWLWKALLDSGFEDIEDVEGFYYQAIEMEKQQIKYAFNEGWVHGNNCIDKPSKEYYNKTFKTNNP